MIFFYFSFYGFILISRPRSWAWQFFVDFFSFHPSTFKLLGIGHCSFFLSFDWVFMASLSMSRVWHSNFGWRGSLWLFFFVFFYFILNIGLSENWMSWLFFFWQAFLCASCHDHFFFLIRSTCYCCFFSYHKIKWNHLIGLN